MNKKAMILYYPILIGFVVGLAVFYVNSIRSDLPGETTFAGEVALNQIKAAKEAQGSITYIREAAKQAVQQSVYDLGLNGGFYSRSECGSYQEYNLWTSETNTCYPDIKKNLYLFLKDNLNYHLKINEKTSRFKDNYDFLIKQGDNKLTVLGIPTIPIQIPISIRSGERFRREIGNYSIRPSFEHSFEYTFEDYETIKQNANEIALICEKEADVQKCVEQKVIAMNALHEGKPEEYPLRWEIGSSSGVERLFYDFVVNYEYCLNSEDTNCRCDFKLDYDDADLRGEYVITVSHDHADTTFELTKPNMYDLAYMIKGHLPANLDRDIKSLIKQFTSFEYSVIYSRTGNYQSTKLIYPQGISEFDLTKGTMLFKKNKERVVFIGRDSTEYRSLEECLVPKVFRFSVINKNNKFMVYDKTTQKAEFKPVEMRFAIHIKDLPPAPIEVLKVQNEDRAENSTLLIWQKSDATDINNYRIYYSKGDFLRREINGHQILNSFYEVESKKIDAKISDETSFERISSSLVYDYDNKIWGHIVYKDGPKIQKLEPDKAYYYEEKQQYFYILDGLADNRKYYFAVTGVDKAGNEIDNKDPEQKLELDKNYVSTTSEDNLAPGKISDLVHLSTIDPTFKTQGFTLKIPTLNEDKTSLKEGTLYLHIYQVKLGWLQSCSFEAVKDKLNIPVTRKYGYPFNIPERASAIPPYTQGDFCYAFILRDESGNPAPDYENLKDLAVLKSIKIS